MKKLLQTFLLVNFLFFTFFTPSFAQSEAEKTEFTNARVTQILEQGGEQGDKYQKLEVEITSGENQGKKEIVEKNRESATTAVRNFSVGDNLILSKLETLDGKSQFIIADYNRSNSLLTLGVVFVAVVLLVGRWKGFRALISLGFSFLILFWLIISQIIAGRDPVLVTIIGSLLILTSLLYLTHGFNMKTNSAVIGTSLSLVFTGIITMIFVATTKLTGLSEDALFVQTQIGNINVYGLLLSGIIIGAVGVLDDLCIGQASAVWELHRTDRNLHQWELFSRAMNIGTDHISATVNTLVMAYVGASLPLVLLISQSQAPFDVIFSTEVVANEIVRAMIGTIGLVFAVPITTLVASYLVKRR